MVIRDRSTFERLVDTDRGTISAEIFSSREIYEQELEQIFSRTWLFVGHESQIPNPGDFIRSRMGEEQVILNRDRQGEIHVLLNSCRHRGNMVCRYDKGNALAFQCSFHGWAYNSAGELATLPPGSEETYAADMHREEWGLLSARVEVLQGTIWANWDKNAPSFVEYLGGAETYLKLPFLHTDGSDNGAEVLGGVMKWKIGMNWKVPMPDHDVTHGWITHRSLRRMGVNAAGSKVSQPLDGNYDQLSQVVTARKQTMQVWFPEGHTTAMRVPGGDESGNWVDGGMYDSWPELKEYVRERYEIRKKRLGELASEGEGPHIFPNMGFFGRVIRVLHPDGPDSTEMWSYFFVDKDAPRAVKAAWGHYYETYYGPGGMTQKDDMENWYALTQYSKGHMTRKMPLNAQLGMSIPSLYGPTEFGLPGYWAPNFSDENTRRFFRRWSEMMVAKDWDDLRIDNSAK